MWIAKLSQFKSKEGPTALNPVNPHSMGCAFKQNWRDHVLKLLARLDASLIMSVDTETTGKGPLDHVIQWALYYKGFSRQETCKNMVPIRSEAFKVHGFLEEHLTTQQSPHSMMSKMFELLSQETQINLLFFNAEFDLRMLRQTVMLYTELNWPTWWESTINIVDVQQFTDKIWPESLSLAQNCLMLQVPHHPPHRALPDAINTFKLFEKIKNLIDIPKSVGRS
ncbi:MAG: 3'-5' exonuclease, partial [Planctomycetes bacterium]|nr:3'-5' exonuclease [Planctomycetota bacterium]